ncbi:MAG: ArgR family transcriptional regulator [Alistipes sp.]|jgi:transcriptional regulator of arginine metabolism|nr:ArgR family transcriptional regulator [Alistipes sp.]MBQ5692933.1 ArgR family transcriptional regulator [Alistipes sp.]MBQ5854708.1 ArgR family transcriptional regulator [Alistipes sp.]
MGKKSERLSVIKRIIADELISSQEELIQHLAMRGVHATQSTLSRDFKEINISKMPHPEKGYIYVSAEHIASRSEMGTSNLGDAILDVKFSGNMGVIITKSGYANAIGVVVDGRKSSDILGTVAGDNTIIMVMKENADHANVLEMLHKTFPSLQSL